MERTKENKDRIRIMDEASALLKTGINHLPESDNMMAVMSQGFSSVKKNIQDNCPVCERPFTSSCRCNAGDRWCALKHHWKPCKVHPEERIIILDDRNHKDIKECICPKKLVPIKEEEEKKTLKRPHEDGEPENTNTKKARLEVEIVDLTGEIVTHVYMIFNEDGDYQNWIQFKGDHLIISKLSKLIEKSLDMEHAMKEPQVYTAIILQQVAKLNSYQHPWDDEESPEKDFALINDEIRNLLMTQHTEVKHFRTHDPELRNLALDRLTVVPGYY